MQVAIAADEVVGVANEGELQKGHVERVSARRGARWPSRELDLSRFLGLSQTAARGPQRGLRNGTVPLGA